MTEPVTLRKVIEELEPYRPARLPAANAVGTARLASNEASHGLDDDVEQAIRNSLAFANRYPDPAANRLVQAIAAAHEVVPDLVVAGCGSVQLIQELVCATCDSGDEVIFPWRSFEAYPTLTRLAGAVPVPVPLRADRIDLEAILAAVSPRTRLVILCSPNNPVGPALEHDDVEALLSRLPATVLVAVDEAYAEYVTRPNAMNGLELVKDHANVVSLRTFSKAYGLAGFRVGYAVCGSRRVADALRRLHLPFSVSAPAQAAAVASLQVRDRILVRVHETARARDELATSLRNMGWNVPQAQGNFVYLAIGDAATAVSAFFDQVNILTRCFDGEGVRITLGSAEDNDRVVSAANAALGLWRARPATRT